MGAPEGHMYNRKWKTSEELEQRVKEYFDEMDRLKEPYTITGLALYLGTSRRTLINYEKLDEEFKEIIHYARLKCENYAEIQLFKSRNVAGVIFNLKNNYGWKDRQEVKQEIDHKSIKLEDRLTNILANGIENIKQRVK